MTRAPVAQLDTRPTERNSRSGGERNKVHALVAQWIERFRPKEEVGGSTPSKGTKNNRKLIMIRAILYDVDGVITNSGFFSERLSKEQNIPIDTILPFFKGVYGDCQLGKADLYTELEKVKSEWGYQGDTSELIDYWFSDITPSLNKELVDSVVKIRDQDTKCYIATNQEINRAEYLWEDAGLSNYFDGIFASYEIGAKKPDIKYFDYVVNKLQLLPEEIIFFDSDKKIVDAANAYGMRAFLYTSFEEYKKVLADL